MKKRLVFVLMLVTALAFAGVIHAQDESLSGELEIFSWWAGDEGPALQALIDLYESEHPDVEIINATVTGGSGTNARAVLKTRMLGGDPPDTFQVHAGDELTGTWVIADRMEPITSLYEDEGWMDVFPPSVIEAVSYEGELYSVPVNIHRSNVMWYVPANMEEWGLEPPADWDTFLNETCPAMQEAGVTPLAVAQTWTVNHLWESVALAELGADGWSSIWTGELDPAGEEMVGVWETFNDVLACTNLDDDAAGLSWQQAVDKVLAGEAGFNIMGDWAAGYMTTTQGLTPGEGFGYMASPGTDGAFLWLSDSFGMPTGAPHPDNTMAWLRLLGSEEGQNTFNPLKGSIPARLGAVDASPDSYNVYLQDTAADWESNTLVGSLAHGTAANERFMSDFNQVMEIFLNSRNPQSAASAMQAFCAQSGACGAAAQ